MTVNLTNTLDIVRKSINDTVCRRERLKIGQFLTPATIARFMASLFERKVEHVRILDAGAGAGVLFSACIETLFLKKHRPGSIRIVAYENAPGVLPHLKETMNRCEYTCREAGIPFQGEIRTEDFVPSAIAQTEKGLFSSERERFTHAILNPPFKKINSKTATRQLLDAAGIRVSNLYAAFAWLASRMLEPGGELVAITPRSFCNGPYFRLFRLRFLDMMSIRQIHVFESRKKAFGDDNVLQENIIYYAIKEKQKPTQIVISSCEDADFSNIQSRVISYDRIILPRDPDAFIHIADDMDNNVMDRMKAFQTSLLELGLDVSTGQVVDFRAKEYLRPLPESNTVPLIYPCHFESGFIKWPNEFTKKPNAIVTSTNTRELLVPSGYYILTKRFSAKEEPRRIVAAIYDPNRITSPSIGFENHLNYFHVKGNGLTENLAKGLALYLNSTFFDQYFRLFSGHTQVNATDLRKMRYPSKKQLQNLGTHIKKQFPNQENIDSVLEEECNHSDYKKRQK